MKLNKKNLISEAKRSIEEAASVLEILKDKVDNSFVKAIEIILSSNKVFVSGVGKSGLIAAKIAATFSSIGVPAFFLNPVEALHGDIGMLEKDDCVILLSKSGTTEEIIRVLPFIKARNVMVISIISNLDSYLGKNSDVVLDGFIEKESCPFNLAPTTSSLVALAIGDALAIALMSAKQMKVRDFAKNHPLGQIGKNITVKVEDVMHKGSKLPIITKGSSLKDALIVITKKELGAVGVTDSKGYLKGIITDGDIRRLLYKTDNLHGLKVEDIMTKDPITCLPDKFLGEALAIMEQRHSQINVLPVVNRRNRFIGIIRLHDIVRTGL